MILPAFCATAFSDSFGSITSREQRSLAKAELSGVQSVSAITLIQRVGWAHTGSRAVGQVIEVIDALRAALCVFYSYRVSEPTQAASLPFRCSDIVAVQSVTLRRRCATRSGLWDETEVHGRRGRGRRSRRPTAEHVPS